MTVDNGNNMRRVLIASSHPIFGEGLSCLLEEQWGGEVIVLGQVSDIDEAMDGIDKLNPDVVIVNYDDEIFNKEMFLARFMEKKQELRVVLLSLKDGDEGAVATVYDRRTLKASNIGEWLQESVPDRHNSVSKTGDN